MQLKERLQALGLAWMAENIDDALSEAASRKTPPAEALARLLDGEIEARRTRSVLRRIRDSRVPTPKSLADFDWAWPRRIDKEQIMDVFRLGFLKEKGNVVFMGGVGLGKTHLMTALLIEACHRNLPVLFTTAVEMINNLKAAAASNSLAKAIRRYAAPAIVGIDEIGFLPIDRQGADLFFQVVSARHERGSIVLSTNKAYKSWAATFANDAVLTSAILDRLTEKCATAVIEGTSYRMRNKTGK